MDCIKKLLESKETVVMYINAPTWRFLVISGLIALGFLSFMVDIDLVELIKVLKN